MRLMFRFKDGQAGQNDGMGGADDRDDDEPQVGKKVKQKKKTAKKSHIVENLDTITSKLKDEYQDVRLFNFKTLI